MFKTNTHNILKNAVHFKPFNTNSNVRCLNGSAHRKTTTDINKVTCYKCLNENTMKGYWFEYEKEHGNVDKIM